MTSFGFGISDINLTSVFNGNYINSTSDPDRTGKKNMYKNVCNIFNLFYMLKDKCYDVSDLID